MPIKGFEEWEDNPRDDTQSRIDAIGKGMAEFGDLGGIVLNRRTGQIVGGHQRARNLPPDTEPVIVEELDEPTKSGTVAIGYVQHHDERWPVRIVDWPEDRAAAAALAANFHGEQAWIRTKLHPLVRKASLAFDRQTLGATAKDIAFARADGAVARAERAAEQAVCETDEPDSKPGEAYVLTGPTGIEHRLVCGDSGDPAAVEKVLDGRKPWYAIADPPYGVGFNPDWRLTELHHPQGKKNRAYRDDSPAEARQDRVWDALPDSIDVLYVWHAMRQSHHVAHAVEARGFAVTYGFVWVKNHPPLARGHVAYQHENLTQFVRLAKGKEPPGPQHESAFAYVKKNRPRHWLKAGAQEGGREVSVWYWPAPKTQALGHGAQKPLMCYMRPMRLHLEPDTGDTVYCPFGGSGTVFIAADQLGLQACAVEIDPTFCDVIRRRFEAYAETPETEHA